MVSSVDITPYKNTKIYKRLMTNTNEVHKILLQNTVAAYENFIHYLTNPKIIIDYQYIWEIICMKNPLLLPNGINLAILDIKNDDITNNVELICPTSSYMYPLYDKTKATVFIIKNDEIYEPIYRYEITSINPESFTYQKTFMATSTDKNIKSILGLIETITNSKCNPIIPVVRDVVFKQNNKSFTDIYNILSKSTEYKPSTIIVNFQHKIIGLMITTLYHKKLVSIYVPTKPSILTESKLPVKIMDDDNIWIDYNTTLAVLKKLYTDTNKAILSLPKYKVVEDNLIVGILTITNQFVQIMPPIEIVDDELPIFKQSNYNLVDKTLQMPISADTNASNTIYGNNLKLESQFYASFRNTVRIILNLYEYRKIKKIIQKTISSDNIFYYHKIKKIRELLQSIIDEYVIFNEYPKEALLLINTITTCQTNCNNKKYCLLSNNINNKCKLIIPINNLITEKSNSHTYYTRLSDELLRYTHINQFVLDTDTENILIDTSGEYIILPNEMLISSLRLTDEYFEQLFTNKVSEYVTKHTYSDAVPANIKQINPTLHYEEYYK